MLSILPCRVCNFLSQRYDISTVIEYLSLEISLFTSHIACTYMPSNKYKQNFMGHKTEP